MPTRPKRDRSTATAVRQPDRRESSTRRGYTYRWQQNAALYLIHHPLCAPCKARGRATPATEVDHIVPHRGDTKLFNDRSNWQPICEPCHKAKTAKGE